MRKNRFNYIVFVEGKIMRYEINTKRIYLKISLNYINCFLSNKYN